MESSPVKNCHRHDTKQPSNISRTYVRVSLFYFSSPAHLVIIRLPSGFPTTRDLCVCETRFVRWIFLACAVNIHHLFISWRQPAKMLISDVSTVGVNVQDLSTKNSCRTSGILTNFWRLCSNIIPNWILAAEMFCRSSINKLEESAVGFFRSNHLGTWTVWSVKFLLVLL